MVRKYINSRGFTLIELMVVVAIISILATLALPKFKTFLAKSYRAEADLTVKQIKTLLEVSDVTVNGGPSAHGSPYYILSDGFGASHYNEHGDCNYNPGLTAGTNIIGFEFNQGDCAKLKHSYTLYYRPLVKTGFLRIYPGAKKPGESKFTSTYFADCVPVAQFHFHLIDIENGLDFLPSRLNGGAGLPPHCY